MTPEELFEKNQRLVYYCLKSIVCPSMWLEDCIQEGMIELWRVCKSFDFEKGSSFSTYAVPCVRGAMQRFTRERVNAIRIPRSMWNDGTYKDVQVSSLNILVDDEKSKTELSDLIPDQPDFYEGLFEDQIDDFLATIPKGKYHDIAEEYLYGCAYGNKPNQEELAEKYHYSQPQVSRCYRKVRKEFRDWLNKIDRGVDISEKK